ncbi:hypothetical protein I0600191H4_13500 [Collinsella sp. i06-0019-1H4]
MLHIPSDEPLILKATASIATVIPISHRYLYKKSLLYSTNLITEMTNIIVNPATNRTAISSLSIGLAIVKPTVP